MIDKKFRTSWNKGKSRSKETKKKISESHIGKKHSEETKKKMSGKVPWNFGKKHSEETLRKISKSLKGLIPWNKGKKGLQKAWNKGLRGVQVAWNKGLFAERSHSWQGGKSFEPYSKKFNLRFKKLIRKRDNQICMLCGIHREKLKRALDVHHVNYNKLLSIPQNCISLCYCCHGKTGINREHWIKFFQSLLSERYSYKYSKDQEIILEVN